MAMAEQMKALGTELFERARAAGRLRGDITWLDVEYLLEFLARVKLGDAIIQHNAVGQVLAILRSCDRQRAGLC